MTHDRDEETLRVGRAARALIETEAYVSTMRLLEAQYVEAMIYSEEGHYGAEAREQANRMLHALRAIANELAGRVAAAAETEARLSLEGDDDDEEIL